MKTQFETQMDDKIFPQQNILTQSEKMSQEYCCNIIRVGELFPIEGSDFLAQTFINGDSIVVRKDEVKTGDVYFFAMCECQLNSKYVGAHSMFRRQAAEKNANFEALKPDIELLETHKESLNYLERQRKKVEREIRYKGAYTGTARANITKLIDINVTDMPDNDIKRHLQTKSQDLANMIKSLKEQITKIQSKLDKACGFFEENCRVKAIKLKQTPSMGFMFSQKSLAAVYPEVAELNLEDYIGYDFDTVMGELFCKVYVPKLPKSKSYNSGGQGSAITHNLIDGEFLFHYDTSILGKNMWKFSADDIIDITDKIHGTSIIISNCKVNYDLPLNICQRIWNKVASALKLNCLKFRETEEDYGVVYSSRKVVRNHGFVKGQEPEYGESVYDLWGQVLHDFIDKDITVYAEVFGYDPYKDKPIQPGYDYGCPKGDCLLMPYRVTKADPVTGTRKEYTVSEVMDFTEELKKRMSDLKIGKHIETLTRYYHGPFKDLYPDIPVDENWHTYVLLQMMKDERLKMEKDETRCVIPVPKEGVVIRKEDERVPAAYKLKCVRFKERETKNIDAGIIDDSEMTEAYGTES